MSVVTVACPGCQSPLRGAENMIGKKARCKKCGTAFRFGSEAGGSSSGDSQMLSTIDLPPATVAAPPPAAKKPAVVTAAKPAAPVIAAPPPDDVPMAAAADDENPPADDPPEAKSADPFAFSAETAALPAPDTAKAKGPAAGEPASPKKAKAVAPRRPAREKSTSGGGAKRVLMLAAVVVLAAGGGVAATVFYFNGQKGGEVAKADAEPRPVAPATPAAPKDEAKGTPDAEPQAKGTPKKPAGPKDPADPAPKATPPGPKGEKFALPPAARPVAVQKAADAPAVFQAPAGAALAVEAPFAAVRRVFPPTRKDVDPAVLWQSKTPFQGFGEKLTLTLFSAQSGKAVKGALLEIEGDAAPDPVCDLAATGDLFAHAAGGKVTVWNVKTRAKLLDGFDPYAAKPDHKAAKLAAVYLTDPPDRLVTVSTAGAVHVWEVGTKKAVGEFVPPKAAAGRVAAGRGVAIDPIRQAVAVAVGGVIHLVSTKAPVGGKPLADLDGDVGRSLALSLSDTGKVLYAFETDDNGKKEQAVAEARPGGKPQFYRWPAEAGEPVAAGWGEDTFAAVHSATGASVWFASEGEFRPLAVARAAGEQARYRAAGRLWVVLPDPADAKKSLAVAFALPPDGLVDPLATERPVVTVRVSEKGLSK